MTKSSKDKDEVIIDYELHFNGLVDHLVEGFGYREALLVLFHQGMGKEQLAYLGFEEDDVDSALKEFEQFEREQEECLIKFKEMKLNGNKA